MPTSISSPSIVCIRYLARCTALADESAVIARDLAPGGKTIAKVPPKTGCDFSIAGEFEDGSSIEIDKVDVCKDRSLNLVE